MSDAASRRVFLLMLNTALNGGLGLAYWILAARLYDADVVGRGAAAISALMLVSSLGWIGVQPTLLRFIPTAGDTVRRLVIGGYGAAVSAAVTAAIVLLAVLAVSGGGIGFLSETVWTRLVFVVAVAVWVVFTLQDGALIGMRRTALVPAENAAYGALKIVLLAAFAGMASPWGLVSSWWLAAAVLVLPMNLLIFSRFALSARAERPGEYAYRARDIAGFALGNHVSGLLLALPDTALPIMVLALAGERASAFYYTAWTVTFSMRLIAVNVASVLIVEGSSNEHAMPHLAGRMQWLVALLFVPGIVIVVGAAPWILSVYGSEYANEASMLLRLLAVATGPFADISLVIGRERVARRNWHIMAIACTSTCVALGLSGALIPRVGVTGAGIAWLAAQFGAAAVAWRLGRRDAARPAVSNGEPGT